MGHRRHASRRAGAGLRWNRTSATKLGGLGAHGHFSALSSRIRRREFYESSSSNPRARHSAAHGVPSQSVNAQDAPGFLKAVAPPDSLGPAMQEYGAVMGPKALDAKTKELIGLAVAAQIPCSYCVYAHTMNARRLGASDDQIKEAVAAAALTRKWSTELNGNMYDFELLQEGGRRDQQGDGAKDQLIDRHRRAVFYSTRSGGLTALQRSVRSPGRRARAALRRVDRRREGASPPPRLERRRARARGRAGDQG